MPQIVIQVLTTHTESLRDKITQDGKLNNFKLKVTQHKKIDRSPGWAKLHNTEGDCGAINVRWEGSSRMLICRVITKAQNNPSVIIANFVHYLLSRYKNKIEAINIIPR